VETVLRLAISRNFHPASGSLNSQNRHNLSMKSRLRVDRNGTGGDLFMSIVFLSESKGKPDERRIVTNVKKKVSRPSTAD
jgi:hypothetical protein